MAAKYEIDQKVRIAPDKEGPLSSRDSALEPYLGQIGQIIDCYWINKDIDAEVFYIYTVRVESDHKEVVLHEDELEAYVG